MFVLKPFSRLTSYSLYALSFLPQFVFCQVCCEPFHLFCLGESERPLQEQFENWCCRRCRFCQACGRQHQKAKVSLLKATNERISV